MWVVSLIVFILYISLFTESANAILILNNDMRPCHDRKENWRAEQVRVAVLVKQMFKKYESHMKVWDLLRKNKWAFSVYPSTVKPVDVQQLQPKTREDFLKCEFFIFYMCAEHVVQ